MVLTGPVQRLPAMVCSASSATVTRTHAARWMCLMGRTIGMSGNWQSWMSKRCSRPSLVCCSSWMYPSHHSTGVWICSDRALPMSCLTGIVRPC
uniref:Putative secreted peptide n=1 Tax=Anopheles braziliensis TaxID=58242 RepID=A0A2M3ZS14_9DIPT